MVIKMLKELSNKITKKLVDINIIDVLIVNYMNTDFGKVEYYF